MLSKTIYINELKENTKIDDIFLVQNKNIAATKNGKPYIALNLSDKTGVVKSRVWDNAEKLSKQFDAGDIVTVKAYSVIYQGEIQLNINNILKISDDDTDLTFFLPSSENDPDQSIKELNTIIDSIKNSHLKKLLQTIFNDEYILSSFKKAPAAKSIHHDYIGGLLDHTLNVTRLAIDVSKHYHNIDQDLLITGAIIHDIGKIEELSYERNFDYTDVGRLIGHISIGVEILNDKIAQLPDFPTDLAIILKHLILSHHGKFEFGSPKRPKTLEAMMLHYLDDIDSKICAVTDYIEKESNPDTKWTAYNRLMERFIYTEVYNKNKSSED
jgi:3'-5' exoribonuclease